MPLVLPSPPKHSSSSASTFLFLCMCPLMFLRPQKVVVFNEFICLFIQQISIVILAHMMRHCAVLRM